MNKWEQTRKNIEGLRFWSPLRRWYVEASEDSLKEKWADLAINDCQNDVHRLVEQELSTFKARVMKEADEKSEYFYDSFAHLNHQLCISLDDLQKIMEGGSDASKV